MIQTTATTITVKKVLPITATTTYVESDMHLEIVYPDNTVKWLEDTEIAFTVTNSVLDTSTGEISCTGTMSGDGRYKFTIYNGTTGGAYTKIGSAYVTKFTNDTVVEV